MEVAFTAGTSSSVHCSTSKSCKFSAVSQLVSLQQGNELSPRTPGNLSTASFHQLVNNLLAKRSAVGADVPFCIFVICLSSASAFAAKSPQPLVSDANIVD